MANDSNPADENPMTKQLTDLPGVWILEPQVYRDARGFFLETYNQRTFCDLGIHSTFVQDNHSRSKRGTVRGLHYQIRHPQAKLCRVVVGTVLDVAVDIRAESPTFGKWTAVELSAENQRQLFIPEGFAHGFSVLSENAEFLYKCSAFYDPYFERGIRWDDPALAVPWGVAEAIVSEKDKLYPRLHEVNAENLPHYDAHESNETPPESYRRS